MRADIELLARLASDDDSPEIAAMRQGVCKVAHELISNGRDNSSPSFLACLGFVAQPYGHYAQSERDRAIRTAAALMYRADPSTNAAALAAEWKKYVTRVWPQVRDEPHPPAGTPELYRCFFYATRFSWARRKRAEHGPSLCAKQINNICGKLSECTFPTEPFTLKPRELHPLTVKPLSEDE